MSKGSYTFILRCDRSDAITIGKLGQLRLRRGYYYYTGSAFGPGGVAARLRHHYRLSANPRWHLDYLRACCEPAGHWFTFDAARREHDWAAALLALPGVSAPMPGFGASDCGCATHLAFSAAPIPFELFADALRQRHPGHAPVLRGDISAIMPRHTQPNTAT